MDRRRFLERVGAGAVAVAGLADRTAADEGVDNPTPVDGTTPYRPKIDAIHYPLAGVPAVKAVGDELRVELDAGDASDPGSVEARLRPSFGRAKRDVSLSRVGADADPGGSRIWNADEDELEDVVVTRFHLPDVVPDLYDLTVSWDGGEDTQPRAVGVFDSIPEEPTVAVLADPQLGDPRALRSGGEEAQREGSPEPFVDRARKLTGDGPGERWEATRRAVAEVNALDPDLVLVAGDLTLGQDAPGKYYAEYEDAWRIVNRLRAPSFCTLGNHDGYVQSGTDGKALYRETFGPPSYAVDVGELHLVAVDTYDWAYLDRLGASAAVSTYGGRVRDSQFEWLDEDLSAAADAGQTVLAFGHHNPSWRPDPKTERERETDGTPAAEQFARGSRYAESGQLWTGPEPYRLRKLFDQTGVAAFFCGHSHRDRIARTVDRDDDGTDDGKGHGLANVVETPGPRSRKARDEPYHYLSYERGGDDSRVGPPVTIERTDEGPHLADRIRNGDGTLWVNCTTTQSATGQYWGWRVFSFDAGSRDFDPARMRYPTSEAFLDDRAVSPDAWNPDHDEVGLFSYPSYLLSVERSGSVRTPGGKTVTVTNDHPIRLSGALTVSVNATDFTVDGGEAVWSRAVGNRTDLKVAYEVPAEGETTVRIE